MNDRPRGSVGGFLSIREPFARRLVRGIDTFADFHQSTADAGFWIQ
ncbi:hypothetical protein [Nevskia ramosa]|nr:hypothetical protein [Nevskia ramosa]